MLLTSADGASFSLRIESYEFPVMSAPTNRYDPNWLVVRGELRTAAGKEWTFTSAALTTREARGVAPWLRQAADGMLPGTSPWDGGIVFMEPTVAFSLAASDGVVVRVHLSQEATPPWAEDTDIYEYAEPLCVTPDDLRAAADEWERELEAFPER